MRVIGIDPGLTRLGYGVVEERAGKLVPVAHGTVRAQGADAPEKLAALRSQLSALIVEHRPEEAAVERLFVNHNRRTATAVGRASGVALACLAELGVPVTEYGPLEVKMSLTGYGKASKEQVSFMVQRLLALGAAPDSPDAADALAIAICHLHSRRLRAAAR